MIWISDNSTFVAAAAAVLLAVAVVLAVLWLRARWARDAAIAARVRSERDRIELDLSLSEEASRMRIVRELHEVAIASLARIIAEADGAKYSATGDPTAPLRATTSIADTARTTLADLRRVVDVVGNVEAVFDSPPGIRDLHALYSVMRDAGLSIAVDASGQAFDLKPGSEVAIYGIVREALENALEHGGPGTNVRVATRWTDDGLQLLIDDDGIQSAARRADTDPKRAALLRSYTQEDDLDALTAVTLGGGITAMRERAEAFGGVFASHTVPGVGFTVSVVFPSLRFHNGVHGVDLTRTANDDVE